jgi:hypothetical protein
MPLIVNGTTIPENVANALMVNGVSVTQVIVNGVAVWTQNLVPVFTPGTSYMALEAYNTNCDSPNTWTIVTTKTFTGGAGSVFSMRASAYSEYFTVYDEDGNGITTTSAGVGSILVNGNEVVQLQTSDGNGWEYSTFVNITLNPGDVVSIRRICYTGGESCGGGGQIFAAQDASAYFV